MNNNMNNNNYNINYNINYNENNNQEILKNNKNNKNNKKLKFADLDLIDRNKPELILLPKQETIMHENFLIFSKDKKVKKTEAILRDEIRPNNYNVSLINTTTNETKIPHLRIDGVDVGAGRGFGNLNISNDIRNGEDSRLENHKFKRIKEAEVIDRFDFLDKNYQNPQNLILPFPRGGDLTRKKPIIRKELDEKKFNFNYNN
jgi:hypothetical protein